MKSSAATTFFYTGEIFEAKDMKKGGFIQNVFSTVSEMNDYTDGLCLKICNKDRLLLSYMKRNFFNKGIN